MLEQLAGRGVKAPEAPEAPAWTPRSRGHDDLSETYDLFSGGRAVSENLALDMLLRNATEKGEEVKIEAIEGVTVKPFDWSKLLKGKAPKADALAAAIPFDQHAIFFPTFGSMVALMDEAKSQSAPILHGIDPRAEDSKVGEFYERQLCLNLGPLSRILGPKVIRGVAMTGSDPYLKTGSDVAVLFDCVQPAMVFANTAANQASAAAETAAAAEGRGVVSKGEAEGVAYQACVSEDDSLRSYVAIIGDVVVVTNSPVQLKAIARTIAKKAQALDAEPEYKFFRDRYPLGDAAETALLVLPDAAIRRWCSPAWRIADSRRVRAAALLSEWQAEQLDALATGAAKPGPLESDLKAPAGDEAVLTKGGARLKKGGGLKFQTPIAENLPAVATKSEADAYESWRRGYESNFRQFFDPIAIRFSIRPDRIAADATVMPLIGNSDYAEMSEIYRGPEILPASGDRHPGTLLHAAYSVNVKAKPFMFIRATLAGMVTQALRADPLAWFGGRAFLYADDSPFWADLAKADRKEVEDGTFFEKNARRIPLALQMEVASPLHMAGFLAAIRAYVETSAPGIVQWENRTRGNRTYVRVAAMEPREPGGPKPEADPKPKLEIFYATLPKAWILTLSEDVLTRALDRADKPPAADPAPFQWLGKHNNIQISRNGLDAALALARDPFRELMQERSWGNLPILNELKRRHPGKDPVALYEEIWKAKPVCPGGGAYAWNEAWKTMESTVYGHPGQPKDGPDRPAIVEPLQSGNFGLTFEDDGLRASFELLRTPAKGKP